MSVPAKYDKIGIGYRTLRQPDPRIEAQIHAALGPGKSLLNVGAGTGSYEPTDRNVVSLEPSIEMIGQRAAGAAPCILGVAEDIPFADKQFDAAMGILTLHHWPDAAKGIAEVMRVTRNRVVFLTFDPEFYGYWLEDYIPEVFNADRDTFQPLETFRDLADKVTIDPVMIPHDCQDGFLCAWWKRPEAYLDPAVRQSISTFSILENIEDQLKALEADIESGAWAEKYKDLLDLEEMDLGYRLVTIEMN